MAQDEAVAGIRGKEMIIRGTTPIMSFGLPFNTERLEVGFVTVQQNGITIFEKSLSACDCDGKTVTARFAQEDTLQLVSDCGAEIRLVVKTVDGERLETKPIVKRVINTSKEGVI
jgi:hypothetical protein